MSVWNKQKSVASAKQISVGDRKFSWNMGKTELGLGSRTACESVTRIRHVSILFQLIELNDFVFHHKIEYWNVFFCNWSNFNLAVRCVVVAVRYVQHRNVVAEKNLILFTQVSSAAQLFVEVQFWTSHEIFKFQIRRVHDSCDFFPGLARVNWWCRDAFDI